MKENKRKSKKYIVVIAVLIILAILLIPRPRYLNDGGTVEYKAVLYNITKLHKLNEYSPTGYDEGTKIEILGIDLNLRIDDLAYGYIQDVNEFYSVGDVIPVKILEIDKENNKLKVSAKELLEDPYKNIRIYFTEGGEYVGTITGYAPNGVYIKLMQGVDAAAIIPIWMNKSPNIGDSVAVRIYEIDVRKRKIYCSLLRVIKEKK